jgi:hypothetical protein
MNERIVNLIEAAEYWASTEPDESKRYQYMMETFAKLIIDHATECVRDVLREEDSDLSYTAATQVQKRIKQYFGVEE